MGDPVIVNLEDLLTEFGPAGDLDFKFFLRLATLPIRHCVLLNGVLQEYDDECRVRPGVLADIRRIFALILGQRAFNWFLEQSN